MGAREPKWEQTYLTKMSDRLKMWGSDCEQKLAPEVSGGPGE